MNAIEAIDRQATPSTPTASDETGFQNSQAVRTIVKMRAPGDAALGPDFLKKISAFRPFPQRLNLVTTTVAERRNLVQQQPISGSFLP
ncbi:hypothetical protein QN224_17275 [Sinorhizobium sp. 8-89]|uniref:hypothetical protein n=1 Tax=Sinorhizobium sp. 7-81 TaxID=3049087 RepID=UPI0024C3A533|nr:hypothetical protein [Sinorhizobium sp. 7-81]MDK1387163.1 hypothetical protein [Sinorhizobium sp. 7-81]